MCAVIGTSLSTEVYMRLDVYVGVCIATRRSTSLPWVVLYGHGYSIPSQPMGYLKGICRHL